MIRNGELFEYTSGALEQMGYNVLTLDFKNPLKSNKYNFLQPVIEQVAKGDIPRAINYCSDIVESLVGEIGNREAIWVNGEKAIIKTGIMAVVMENAEDKVTEEKIEILYENEIKNGKKVEDLMKQYQQLSQIEKDRLRNQYLENKVLGDFATYMLKYLLENDFFAEYRKLPNDAEIVRKLKKSMYYKLDDILREFHNFDIKDTEEKNKMKKKLANWKVLNDLRPHTEYQNITNVYNFISMMCAEQNDKEKSMLIDTYLDSLPPNHPVIMQFAAAKLAPSKTRASFFTSALATLSTFVDEYVANMINESEIDLNQFNKQKTILYLILPDEKVTFYRTMFLICKSSVCKIGRNGG